jgi:acylphosphatase
MSETEGSWEAHRPLGDSLKRLTASAIGRVQGVGYRYFIVQKARRLGLTGWVRNEPDGSVRIVAEGEEAALAALLSAAGEGPGGAVIRRVHHEIAAPTGEFDRFDARF